MIYGHLVSYSLEITAVAHTSLYFNNNSNKRIKENQFWGNMSPVHI